MKSVPLYQHQQRMSCASFLEITNYPQPASNLKGPSSTSSPPGALLSHKGPPQGVCEQKQGPYLVPFSCIIVPLKNMNGLAEYTASDSLPISQMARRAASAFLERLCNFTLLSGLTRRQLLALDSSAKFNSRSSQGPPAAPGAQDPQGRNSRMLPEANNSSQLFPAACCH